MPKTLTLNKKRKRYGLQLWLDKPEMDALKRAQAESDKDFTQTVRRLIFDEAQRRQPK